NAAQIVHRHLLKLHHPNMKSVKSQQDPFGNKNTKRPKLNKLNNQLPYGLIRSSVQHQNKQRSIPTDREDYSKNSLKAARKYQIAPQKTNPTTNNTYNHLHQRVDLKI
ncbi:hypothetical protein, partial [Donghicola mangrovi]|uniref:hypothetical protein n=1 Tax=Donghicola mangrovi TaxID=2729614 RepID=UPI001D159DD0